MFAVDHAATALVIKRRFPTVPLAPLLISVQAMELAWVGLNYAGIERTTTGPVVRSVADIHLAYMPFSHSVATAAAAALLAWLVVEKAFGRALLGRAIGLGVISHLLLDLATHARDIAWWPGSPWPAVGLGLYDRAPMLAFTVELAYGFLCWRLFRGRRALLGAIVLGNVANVTLFSATLPGPEALLAGHPLAIVTLVFAQIVVMLGVVGALATSSDDHRQSPIGTTLAVDRAIVLDVNGSAQPIRLRAERTGLPPLLIVQAGPGVPALHEVPKFQKRLQLERDFLVAYWEQRGCGVAPRAAANSVSLQQQVDDLGVVVRWLHEETKSKVLVLAISLGATAALRAAERGGDHVAALVAISADARMSSSDASADTFIRTRAAAAGGRLLRRARKLGDPPYLDLGSFQRRATLLGDLGAIERGKSFGALLVETLFGMIKAYGIVGAVKALRNMNAVQRAMLPELPSLDLIATPPRLAIPVHYVFGEEDPLSPIDVVRELPAAIPAPGSTVTLVPAAGHMVHFERPDIVRSIVMNAQRGSPQSWLRIQCTVGRG